VNRTALAGVDGDVGARLRGRRDQTLEPETTVDRRADEFERIDDPGHGTKNYLSEQRV